MKKEIEIIVKENGKVRKTYKARGFVLGLFKDSKEKEISILDVDSFRVSPREIYMMGNALIENLKEDLKKR